MPARMTAAAWGQGLKNALIVLSAVLVFWGILLAGIVLVFRQPILDGFCISFAVLAVLILTAFLGTWFYGRHLRGPVLLDCGPYSTPLLSYLEAVVFLAMGLMFWESLSNSLGQPEGAGTSNWFRISLPIVWVALALHSLIQANGRLQMRENGIWKYWALLRWEKVGSYRWASDTTLIVRAKGFFPFFFGALPVPPEQKADVEELLAKRCPNAATNLTSAP